MLSDSNDLQNANQTAQFSSVHSIGHKGGFFVTTDNLWQSAVLFSARRLIKPTWINDRDQFLQPSQDLPNEFINDCLLWMLFNGSNLTASADDLEWNKKSWSIVNHFIPFTESEVNAPERFESNFMVEYLSEIKLSNAAQLVLNAGLDLWSTYFTEVDPHNVREEYRLNRSDVGWYQIRNALKARNETGLNTEISFALFEDTYRVLSEKLRPLVFEYRFLRVLGHCHGKW